MASAAAAPALPAAVVGHPLLQRLAPELRERVVRQLQGIAMREALVDDARRVRSVSAGAGSVQPPANHTHAHAQTTFPVDAAMQTETVPPDPPPPNLAAVEYFAPVAAAAPPAAAPAHSPPPPPPPPQQQHAQQQRDHRPPVGSYQDAMSVARELVGQHPAVQGARSEAHTRLLAERLLAEHHMRQPPPLEPQYSQAAGLGFPGPGDPEQSGGIVHTSPAHGLSGQPANIARVQQGVRDEFWRHFNAEFDRAVLLINDPDADSLLRGDAALDDDEHTYGRAEGDPAYYSTRPDDVKLRDETREQVQSLFWDHYAKSLDSMIRPGASIDFVAAANERDALAAVGQYAPSIALSPPSQGPLRDKTSLL